MTHRKSSMNGWALRKDESGCGEERKKGMKIHSEEQAIVSMGKNGLCCTAEEFGTVRIEPVEEGLWRFFACGAKRASDWTEENGPYLVEKKDWPSCAFTPCEEPDGRSLRMRHSTLAVCSSPFSWTVSGGDGTPLSSGSLSCTPDGVRVRFSLSFKEKLYGLGLRDCFPLNGHSYLHRIQLNLWEGKSVPFLVSTAGYGVFFNITRWESEFSVAESEPELSVFVPGEDPLEFYVLTGGFDRLLHTYHDLTGHCFLPPLWSLGYWHGKNSYRTQEEAEEVFAKFREKRIPCDVAFQDLAWRGSTRAGVPAPMKWDYDSFPEPKEMIRKLKQQGYHYFSHVNTGCLADHKDFTDPDDLACWKENLWPLFEDGVDGFMIDAGEGKGTNPNFMDWNIPKGRFHNGMTPEQMANVWGLLYNKTVVENLREFYQNERKFGLVRVGTSGSQRYGLVWSGDHKADWEDFRREFRSGMNMSLSGLPFWTFDIGGIEGRPTKELYIRWLQAACFTPVIRMHGTFEREPWLFGKRAESIARRFLALRMRLLPYMYTAAWRMAQTGEPMARPLVWDYPEDPRAQEIWDEWFFGGDLLVAPVMEEGAVSRSVYLPQGDWVEIATGKVYNGGCTLKIDAPLESVPLFLRRGGIVPLGPEKEYAAQPAPGEIELVVFPAEESRYCLYDDDGETYAYRTGESCVTEIICRRREGSIEIDVAKPVGGYRPAARRFSCRVLGDCAGMTVTLRKEGESNGGAEAVE